jgi:hypothetical protein
MVDRAASPRDRAVRWIETYEELWRTTGTDRLGELFAEDATYSMGPYESTEHGLAAIAELWERERVSADERFTMESEVIAIDDDVAVARIEVHYFDKPQEYRDLWIVRFGADGRCVAFEEWPFWPDADIAP